MKPELLKYPGVLALTKIGSIDQYKCDYDLFVDITFFIESHYSYVWLVDIIATEESQFFSIKYKFCNVEMGYDFFLSVDLPVKSKLSSVGHLWRNSQVFEQEIQELFGIEFNRQYPAKLFKNFEITHSAPHLKDFKASNLKVKDLENSKQIGLVELRSVLNREQIKFNISNDDDIVETCEIEPGLAHIGLEKILEGEKIEKVLTTFESYLPLSNINWSVLISRIIEDSEGIQIPARAQATRMILLELSRIVEHLHFLSELSFELENNFIFKKSLSWISHVQSLLVSYTGNEHARYTVRPGGVTKDTSQTWLSRIIEESSKLEKSLLQSYKYLVNSGTWKRALSAQLMTKPLCAEWSITGPLVRSVGFNLDKRKLNPFYFYKDVEFEIPLGSHGSAFDVFLVRFEEIFQSLNIIVQVVDNMPTSEILSKDSPHYYLLLDKYGKIDEAKYIESIHNQYAGLKCYSSLHMEGSSGWFGMHLDYDNQVKRIKVNSQHQVSKQFFEKIISQKNLDDVVPVWSCFNINMKEVER